MKKEVVIAVLIGLTLGLIITYGVYTAKTSLSKPRNNVQQLATTTPSPEATSLSSLALLSPNDESIQTKKEVTVTGTTIANSFIVVFVNDEETITTADESGNFSVVTDLQEGSNVIVVYALDEDGKATTAERTVVYLTSALTASKDATPSATPKPTASPKPSASPTTKTTIKVTPTPSPKP